VVGVDTHRDTHEVEIAYPSGTPIATITISNDTAGYAELLAWILQHAPGPRVAVSIEGTRSYGAGLARAVTAAGLVGAWNFATLRDLHVFVDDSAESIASDDLGVGGVGLGECSQWGGLVEGSVWSVGIEVIFILSEDSS
jgi:transposase